MANISLNLSEIENSGLLQRYYANILQGSCYLQRQSDAKKYLNNNNVLTQISSPAVDMFMLQTSVGENLICAGSPALGASMCRGSNNNIILTICRHTSDVWQCSGSRYNYLTRCFETLTASPSGQNFLCFVWSRLQCNTAQHCHEKNKEIEHNISYTTTLT